MSKQRIYEYAKELNLKSKDIIDELKSMNVEVSNHMQALEKEQITALDKNSDHKNNRIINKKLKIITKNHLINQLKNQINNKVVNNKEINKLRTIKRKAIKIIIRAIKIIKATKIVKQ